MDYEICYMGIDPGKTGAAALYFPKSEEGETCFEFLDWPKDNNPKSVLEHIEKKWKGYSIQYALLEKVSSMHKQGVKSVFTFGVNYGMWQAILAALNMPYRMMPPQQWQKELITKSDGNTPKERSKKFVERMWPHDLVHFKGSRGAWKDGRADAAIMAYKAYLLGK